jgi:hypothetical protein
VVSTIIAATALALMTRSIISTTATAGHLHQLNWTCDRRMTSAFATNVTGWIICAMAGKGRGRQYGGRNKNCKQLDFHDISPRFRLIGVCSDGRKYRPFALHEADSPHQVCVRKSAIRADTYHPLFYSLKSFDFIYSH